MAFHPYPVTPGIQEAIPLLVDVIRGKPVDTKEAIHAGWHVAGYGLSKWDVHPPGFNAAPKLEGEALACALEDACAPGFKGGALNWESIVNGVLDLIQSLLTK